MISKPQPGSAILPAAIIVALPLPGYPTLAQA